MMRLPFRSGAVVAGALVVMGCASGQSSTMSATDAIAARQQLMKEQGAAAGSMQNKMKAGQTAAVAVDAEKLAQTSNRIPTLFPAGSVNPQTSRAKPEIWQKWAEFEGYAKTLNSKSTQLAATARTGNAEATNAAIADLSRTTCVACHNAFRGPEIKK